jgi:oxygen-independent coproporphyrinogen-3 oxidase
MENIENFFGVYPERDRICVSFYPLPKVQPSSNLIPELMELNLPDKRFRKKGIYVHVPFCDIICTFCPFNKFLKNEDIVLKYLDSLKREMDLYSETPFAKSSVFDSIYLGGGTPSSLSSSQIVEIISNIKTKFRMTDDAVYFVEGNPMNYTDEKLKTLSDFGVNRISMGVQTFNDNLAKYLDLPQTPDQSHHAIKAAHEAGIPNVGIDLMYPLPGMKYSDWTDSIQEAIDLKVDHICLIGFCVVPNTPIAEKIKTGKIPAPMGIEDEIKLYHMASEMLLKSGYEQYSVIDFCLPGKIDKAALNYFSKQADLLAFGPASFGYINGYTYFNIGDLMKYMETVDKGDYPVIVGSKADFNEEMYGMMAKSLRMLKVDKQNFYSLFKKNPSEVFASKIKELSEKGLLQEDNDYISLTPKGIIWGNDVSKEFFSEEYQKKPIERINLVKGRVAATGTN